MAFLASLIIALFLAIEGEPHCVFFTDIAKTDKAWSIGAVPSVSSITCEGTFSMDTDGFVYLQTPHHTVVFHMPADFTVGWIAYHWGAGYVELHEPNKYRETTVVIGVTEWL